MRGDIDGDGKITQNDRNRINEHLGGTITLTGADSWCAKVTGNNEISVSDLVQLMQYLEGKTNNLTGIPTFADYYNNWTYHNVKSSIDDFHILMKGQRKYFFRR